MCAGQFSQDEKKDPRRHNRNERKGENKDEEEPFLGGEVRPIQDDDESEEKQNPATDESD